MAVETTKTRIERGNATAPVLVVNVSAPVGASITCAPFRVSAPKPHVRSRAGRPFPPQAECHWTKSGANFYEKALFVKPTVAAPLCGGCDYPLPFALCFYSHSLGELSLWWLG